MITYRDMSFCMPMKEGHPLCSGCARVLTTKVLDEAKSLGLPVSQFKLAPDPQGECKLFLQKR